MQRVLTLMVKLPAHRMASQNMEDPSTLESVIIFKAQGKMYGSRLEESRNTYHLQLTSDDPNGALHDVKRID